MLGVSSSAMIQVRGYVVTLIRTRGSVDAAEDEPALDLAFLHGILVLPGHLGNLLGDVGLETIHGLL
jgi:hypothetical protein